MTRLWNPRFLPFSLENPNVSFLFCCFFTANSLVINPINYFKFSQIYIHNFCIFPIHIIIVGSYQNYFPLISPAR
jgi:hypothetical protein